MAPPGHIESHGLTDIGKVREVNEDQFLIADVSKTMLVHQSSLSLEDQTRLYGGAHGQLLIVADGIGGRAAGKLASKIAVDTIASYMLNTIPWFLRLDEQNEDDFLDELKSVMERCQSSIQADAEVKLSHHGMGTTLTMAYVTWPRLYVIHVGDSRCYLLRRSKLEQITTDHTVAQQIVDAAGMRLKAVDSSQWSHILWNVIGGDTTDLQPEVYKTELKVGDTLLLCTDGLTGHVNDKNITQCLQRQSLPEKPVRPLCAPPTRRAERTTLRRLWFVFTELIEMP